MSYTLESWATLKDDPSKAVKLTVKLDEEPDLTTKADYRAKATGLFRTVYHVWADSLGERVTGG